MLEQYKKSIYTLFPFQSIQLENLSIVFEKRVLHDVTCANNNYKYIPNISYATQNSQCGNLQFNKQLENIIKRIEIVKDHTNYRYLNYNQLTARIEYYKEIINDKKLTYLNKGE